MKHKEVLMTFEQIIVLFASAHKGLSTQELYERMRNEYSYSKTKRTLIGYMNKLAQGAVDNVHLTLRNRTKHMLKDNRVVNKEALEKKQEKILQNERLMQDEKVYMRLAVESIKGMSNLSSTFHKEIEQRLKLNDIESAYFIESEKLEPVNRDDYDFRELKSAIRGKYLIRFEYSAKSSQDSYVIEPYKLIISNNLWYLYGKDLDEKDSSPYKTWRIKYIKNVDCDLSTKHDVTDEEIETVLSTIHSPFFVVGEEIMVQVKIDFKIIEEYSHHAHLPGVFGEPEVQMDGSLILHAKVSTLKELEKEIKMWLPYIQVLEPKGMQEKLMEELSAYLSKYKKAM